MHTILLTVAYDGTDYCGWQYQENGPTVQAALENALSAVFGERIGVIAASRTDAGVHAMGQRAAFSVGECRIPIAKLCEVINSHLPRDIVLRGAEDAAPGFNPRFSAREKTYIYRIYNSRYPDPLSSRYSWHVPYALDLDAMARAGGHFTGRHDFAAFCAAGSSAKTTVRSVYACEITRTGDMTEITVRGDGFLYNMVRIIAGTLVYVGGGKIMPEEIPGIILSRDRARAGQTAPAKGLCLCEVRF